MSGTGTMHWNKRDGCVHREYNRFHNIQILARGGSCCNNRGLEISVRKEIRKQRNNTLPSICFHMIQFIHLKKADTGMYKCVHASLHLSEYMYECIHTYTDAYIHAYTCTTHTQMQMVTVNYKHDNKDKLKVG